MVNNKESFYSTLVFSGTFCLLSITSSIFVSAIFSFYQELKFIFLSDIRRRS